MDTHFWFRVHSFTGIVTGLMLFLICWTGTFAVISYELDWLVTPELRLNDTADSMNWPAIIDHVQKDPSEALYVTATPYGGPVSAALFAESGGYFQRLYHPVTGEPFADISAFDIQRFFRDLHRRIFYPNPWGLYLVCFFALTMLTSLIAALYFYKRWWRRFFQFKAHNRRAFFSASHKLAGLWSIWFILIISLTSVWYIYESVRFQFVDGVISYVSDSKPSPVQLEKLEPQRSVSGEKLINTISHAFPELEVQSFRPDAGGYFYADGQANQILVREGANEIWLKPDTAEVVYLQDAENLSAYWLWSDMADPLHFGDFAGLYSKAIWFIFGLLLSFIILTGTYLHGKRIQSSGKYNWKLAHIATATTMLVWLASVPMAFNRVYDFTASQQTDGWALEPGVMVFILGWVAMTLLIIGFWHYLLTMKRNKRSG
ncbi:PepSY-associated TM helix domain-containing protein [Methylophaga sp.]|uniref:PepSY-associated TM helix domain-containing protein n=1 Tax=Methylophaga sp. TaxID=2024840 RepID=UPI003F69B3CD